MTDSFRPVDFDDDQPKAHGPTHVSSDSGRTLATVEDLGSTLVATILGRTLSGHDAMELAAHLAAKMRLAGPVTRHIVLDLQNVEYMDSGCVGVLVELLGELQAEGGRIALVNAAQNVEYLFKLTRLDRVFPICRDVLKALEAVERAA